MRASRHPIATTIVVGLLVAACSTAPSPAPASPPAASWSPPAASPSPEPSDPPPPMSTPGSTPIATPAATGAPTASPPESSGWPYRLGDSEPAFGPDGTAYFLARDAGGAYQRRIVALDEAGQAKPGWPIEAPPGSHFGSLAVSPDGSIYVEACGDPTTGCVIHRLDPTGRDVSGWPIEVACPTRGCRYASILGIGPKGSVYLTGLHAEEFRLIAIDSHGETIAGWPLVLDGYDWSDAQLGSDGTVYLVRRPVGTPTFDPVKGAIDDDAELWAFGPNGKRRSGWPVPVPDIRQFLIDPQGNVVVWSLIDDVGELCVNPRRTLFTVLGPDGRTLPGWPRGSTGHASPPVVGADGNVYYVSATYRVYAHDRAGEVKAGWPVAVPGAGNGCGPDRPILAPDGTVYVVGDEVTALSADGRSRPGWPYRSTGSLSGPCFDSECFGGPGGGILGPDGALYLIVYHGKPGSVRAEVIALDRQGRVTPGWPYRVPFDANAVPLWLVAASPDGRLFLQGGDLLVSLDPDGRVSQ
jgi:hypothetical protein